MAVSLSPVFNGEQFFDANGLPLALGKIHQYAAGSDSIEEPTYTTAIGVTANDNPMILDGSGRPLQNIWLTDGTAYHLVISDSSDVLQEQVDNVTGVPVISTSTINTINIWNPETDSISYVSATEFLIANNHISDFAVGNRIRASVFTGYIYGTVTSVSFSSPNTYVIVQMDSNPLDSSLTTVDWSTLIQSGRTVDISAVSWTSSLAPYTDPTTAGGHISTIEANLTALTAYVDTLTLVYTTTGTSTAYEISAPDTSYSINQQWQVEFHTSNGATPTFNVNSIGALLLKQYDSTGAYTDPVIVAGMVTDIMYDGTYMIVVDRLVTSFSVSSVPHGDALYTSDDDWVAPADVYSINVSLIGGGGGAGMGYSYTDGFGNLIILNGGNGGYGGNAFKRISVTPGDSYHMSIGIGGAASTGSGGTAGGATTFGATVVQGTGGGGGTDSNGVVSGVDGANGSSPTTGAMSLFETAFAHSTSSSGNHGIGGVGFFTSPTAGTSGMVYLEW